MAGSEGRSTLMTVLSGFAAIVLGVLLLVWPGMTLQTFIYLFGLLVLGYGVMHAIAGLFGATASRLWGVLGGLLAIVAGIVIIAWPEITGLTLLYIIAIWAIVTGAADLAGAFAGGLSGGRRVLLLIAGLVSVVFGILLFAWPASGALAILWLIGIYLLILGIFRVTVGLIGGLFTSAAHVGPAGPGPR